MMHLTELNFMKSIQDKKIIVMFYREEGCSFCDKAKPVFESYEGNEKAMYALAMAPDSINEKFPIERFPTFYAFENGKPVNKIEGVPTHEKLDQMFAPKGLRPEQAPMLMLLNDKAVLIDKIAELKMHLNNVISEIKKREDLAGL